jgi:hypothetical protein
MTKKPKPKSPKEDDKEQSARFIATARELDVDETGDDFSKLTKVILKVKQHL